MLMTPKNEVSSGNSDVARHYATAYEVVSTEHYTTGMSSVFANSYRETSDYMAGQMVRIICERGDKEVKYRPDGVIKVNHDFPSTKGMTVRERVSNRLAKIIVGFVGEGSTSIYTPISDEHLSAKELAEFRQENEDLANIKLRIKRR